MQPIFSLEQWFLVLAIKVKMNQPEEMAQQWQASSQNMIQKDFQPVLVSLKLPQYLSWET